MLCAVTAHACSKWQSSAGTGWLGWWGEKPLHQKMPYLSPVCLIRMPTLIHIFTLKKARVYTLTKLSARQTCFHTLESENPTFLMTASAEKPSLQKCLFKPAFMLAVSGCCLLGPVCWGTGVKSPYVKKCPFKPASPETSCTHVSLASSPFMLALL